MPRVAGVIAGSRYIADWCLAEGAPRADVLWTGAEVSPGHRPPQAERPPLVAWAQTRPMDYGAEALLQGLSLLHNEAIGTVGSVANSIQGSSLRTLNPEAIALSP